MKKIILILFLLITHYSIQAQNYKIYTVNKNDSINIKEILYLEKDTVDTVYLVWIDNELLPRIKNEFIKNPYIVGPFKNKWVCLKNNKRGSIYYEFYENYGLKILKIW